MEDDNVIVKIQQDIHFKHNKRCEPVFTMSIRKPFGTFAYGIGYTVPDMIAIKDAITMFLEMNHAGRI